MHDGETQNMQVKDRIFSRIAIVGLLAIFAHVTSTLADEIPTRVGVCTQTTIKEVTNRLEGTPGSGSAVLFANGISQTSYDQIEAVDQSREGDPVRICLVSIPENCPKGDDRGYQYRTTNLRTHKVWQLFNSEHMCGGA